MVDQSTPQRATAKAVWRILPLLFLCYVVAYVDRANVGYAKLTLTRDLPAFNERVIGLGGGLFFLGYFLLELPGSMIVERWSARKWLARIMVTWGLIAAATAFVHTPTQFYIARFSLGLAEAGFFPGVIIYLTHWFPSPIRARVMSIFLVATPIAQLAAPKACNYLLGLNLLGMKGWQWVFIAWGLPAVALGVMVLLWLPDRPAGARWLSNEEKDALETELKNEKQSRGPDPGWTGILTALNHPGTWLLAGVLFSVSASNYALETFLPTMLRDWYGLSRDAVTWWMMVPPICALIGLILIAKSSDRFRERRLHAAACTILAGIALVAAPGTHGILPLTILCMSTYAIGNKGSQPPFWAMPSLMLTGSAAAAATGIINSVGNLGGFAGQMALGWLATQTGSFLPGLYLLAACLILMGIILAMLPITLQANRQDDN